MAMIKCPDCGREISDKAAACVGCGCPVTQSTIAAETREADKPEVVLMKGLCNKCGKFSVQNGSAMLTNHRFVYMKHSLTKTLAIGVFVNLTQGDFEFDIPLDKIASIEDGRHGISKTLVITTIGGEKYNFYFNNREEWKIKIQSAMSAY